MLSNVSIFFLKYNMRNTNYSSKNEIIVPSDNIYIILSIPPKYYNECAMFSQMPYTDSSKLYFLNFCFFRIISLIKKVTKISFMLFLQHDQLLFDQKLPSVLFKWSKRWIIWGSSVISSILNHAKHHDIAS